MSRKLKEEDPRRLKLPTYKTSRKRLMTRLRATLLKLRAKRSITLQLFKAKTTVYSDSMLAQLKTEVTEETDMTEATEETEEVTEEAEEEVEEVEEEERSFMLMTMNSQLFHE
jgi:hypothetical protein